MSADPPSPSENILCPVCGTANLDWRVKCTKCGAMLDSKYSSARPLFLTVYGWGLIVVAVISYFQLLGQFSERYRYEQGLFLFSAVFLLIPLAIEIAIAVGLLQMRNWARILAIIGNGLTVIIACGLLSLDTTGSPAALLVGGSLALFSAFVIYWLHVNRYYFYRSRPAAPPGGADSAAASGPSVGQAAVNLNAPDSTIRPTDSQPTEQTQLPANGDAAPAAVPDEPAAFSTSAYQPAALQPAIPLAVRVAAAIIIIGLILWLVAQNVVPPP